MGTTEDGSSTDGETSKEPHKHRITKVKVKSIDLDSVRPSSDVLAFVDTTHLIAELRSRFRTMHLVGEPLSPKDYGWRQAYLGTAAELILLLEQSKARLLKSSM